MNKSKVLPILIILVAPIFGCGTPVSKTTDDFTSVPVVDTVESTASPPISTQADSSSRSSVLSQLSGTGEVNRSVLTYVELMGGFEFDSPVNEGAFAIPDEAAPPNHVFEGRLELFGENTNGDMQVLRGELEPESARLPEFDFEFVQSGTYLIPKHRGLIIADHPNWNYILEPGRVWQEDSDNGYSRASFPFALVWKGGNAAFDGTMTFLFEEEGVSEVWYQITQETTSFTRANFWGLLEATYHPGRVQDADRIRADFSQELANRFPTKPIEQLAEDYPGVDISAFGRGISPEHLTWYGFVIDGVNYVGGCHTRFGQYAYCESMRATSYSTAKSAFVSVALMRLAQKYGPEVADLLIKDYVPEYEQSPGEWARVTFNNTVDMATGNYESAGYMVDEDGAKMGKFFEAQPYAARIAAAFDWPNSARPGENWVYRTCDTFILTRAMHNYLQSREGADADIFQFVVDEIYKPLGIGPGTFSTMRTADNSWQGQAEGGYGLWWTQDDIAKIATLLNNAGGEINGVQVLHPDLLKDALQQDPGDRGVKIDARRMYNNAFWSQKYGRANGFACEVWVPQMLGVSGNAVVLMPNGTTYYYFSDNMEFTWDSALSESNKISSFCK
jgi:CubicO group peptidase (beta-lactamase class C family)